MTAKSLLNEFRQHYPLCHTEGTSTEEWQDGHIYRGMARWVNRPPECCAFHPYTPLVSGQKTDTQQYTSSLCKGQAKDLPSKVVWESALGCQWLLRKLLLKQQHHPALSHIQLKFPASSPHSIPNQPRPYGERLAFSTNMAKRERAVNQTPLSQPGMEAERTKAGIHIAACFSTSQTCHVLENILLGCKKYISRMYKKKVKQKYIFQVIDRVTSAHQYAFFFPLLSGV